MEDNVFHLHHGKKCRRDRRRRETKAKIKRFGIAIQKDDVLYQVFMQATIGTMISVVVSTATYIVINTVVNRTD